MMKLTNNINILSLLVGLISLWGCTDEALDHPQGEIIEGEPVALSLNLEVAESSAMSRGEIPTGMDTEVNSLWLGFFDYKTGLCIHKRMLGLQSVPGEHIGSTITLNGASGEANEAITSGNYYIAAVANPHLHSGVIYSNDKKSSTVTELDELLMNSVVTFDDFQGIAYMRGDGTVGSIGTPTGNILMQGVFIPSAHERECNFSKDTRGSSDFFAKYSQEPVYVMPSKNSVTRLDGAIHFRRVISHNQFHISYNDKNIESFEIEQVMIYNVPAVSWLAERADGEQYTNAGDVVDIIGNKASGQAFTASSKPNYPESSRIYGTTIKVNDDNSIDYDWWQLENRRQGNTSCTSYDLREKEYKDASNYDRNTGVYKALSSTAEPVEADNNATYLEIRARLKLKDNAIDSSADMKGDPLTEKSQLTEAEAIYTIHLGYCEGDDLTAKSRDFNCRRNCKYTYNVRIENVNSIFVEAKVEDQEPNPGAEGTITFVTDKLFEADAHYCTYNIFLSDEEREDINWQIRYYKTMTDFEDICLVVPNELARPDQTTVPYTDREAKYWQWVVFRPTTDENTIADYVPVGMGDGKSFYLDQLRNYKDYPGIQTTRVDKDGKTEKGCWYTVFVNEYVYPSSSDGSDPANAGRMTDNWRDYVNLPDRSVWIRVQEYRSIDHQSIVINSKYAIRQKSIQTFYKADNGKAVFGAENTNETDFGELGNDKYLADSHKSSVYHSEGSYPRIIMYNFVASSSEKTAGKDGNIDWTLYMNKHYWLNNPNIGVSHIYTPQDTEYNDLFKKSMGYACLNRNRDLNGNGKIDLNEVRWVLPDQELYTLMFFSASGLKYPLFDLRTPASKVTPAGGSKNKAFHYATIDGEMFWSEEGCSIGYMGSEGGGWPTQIRCVRYLNNDTHSNSYTSPIADTFTQSVEYVDDQEHCYITCDLVPEALRDVKHSITPAHRVGDEVCRPYHKFEYEYDENGNAKAHEYIKTIVTQWNTRDYSFYNYESWLNYLYNIDIGTPEYIDYIDSMYTNDKNFKWNTGDAIYVYKALETANNPCVDLNVNGEIGWRPANIKELAAIKEAGYLPQGTASATICFGNDNRLLVYNARIEASPDTNNRIICVRDVD